MSEATEYKPDYSFGGLYPRWRIARDTHQDTTELRENQLLGRDIMIHLEQEMREKFPVEWAHVFGGSAQ